MYRNLPLSPGPVKRHTTGFYIIAEGHSHKLPLLLSSVLQRIAAPSIAIDAARRFARSSAALTASGSMG